MDLLKYVGQPSIPKKLENDIIDEADNAQKIIKNLSKVNVFIGPNNSGKSLLVREIIKSVEEGEKPSLRYQTEIQKILDSSLNEILEIKNKRNGAEFFKADKGENFDDTLITQVFQSFSIETNNLSSYIENTINTFFNHSKKWSLFKNQNGIYQMSDGQRRNISTSLADINTELSQSLSQFLLTDKISRIYIPTTRTLRVFDGKGGIFKEKTWSEYAFESSEVSSHFAEKPVIENGENFYETILSLRNSTTRDEDKVKEFQKFLEVNFFENKEVRIITNTQEKVLYIKIGNEREQPIYNLGDGLQMVIILTFFLFNYETGIIGIEEPELFIHPGLQRKLLEIYSTHPKSKNFIIYIVTHSNHILDSASQAENASVFSMTKRIDNSSNNRLPKFVLRALEYGDSKFLNSIGVSNTSVFLSNCTIWIEGITDKLYLIKYIEEYLKNPKLKSRYKICSEFKEGINYNFVLTAGDNIIHSDFSDEILIKDLGEKIPVKYICGNSLVIVDNDDNKNEARKKKLKQHLKLRFFELPVIEVESLLSYDVILKSIKKFGSWKDLDVSKCTPFSESDYAEKRLGSFIDKEILSPIRPKKPIRKFFSEDVKNQNSTLNCKIQFCRNSIDDITYKNMTESSKKVVETILDFIKSKN